MSEVRSGPLDALLTDLRALLGFVGTSRRPLTGTGRLRLADVRAMNSLLMAPEPMDREVAGKTYPIRTEDEARRVHFLRLLCEAGGLVATPRGRLVRTPGGAAIAAGSRALEDERLFTDWWWRGAWDLLPRGMYAARGPEEDREWTADALRSFGETETPLVELGARFNRHFGPPAPVHPDLHVDMWARAVLWTCLAPLGAFGGCAEITEHRRIEPFTSKGQAVEYEETVAFRLTPQGLSLLDAALRASERTPSRRSAIPERRPDPFAASAVSPRGSASTAERHAAAERAMRVAAQHPELVGAAARGAHADELEARVHLLLHEGVEEMLNGRDVPVANSAYEQLVAAGRDPHEAVHMLADAVTQDVLEMQAEGTAFDRRRFAARLATLARIPFASEEGGAFALDRRELAQLRRLPRSDDVWEGDVRLLPLPMALATGWASTAVWVSARDTLPRGIEPRQGDDAAALLRGFVDAALHPSPGFRRELPARLRVKESTTADALRESLAPLGVAVEAATPLRSTSSRTPSRTSSLMNRRWHRSLGMHVAGDVGVAEGRGRLKGEASLLDVEAAAVPGGACIQ